MMEGRCERFEFPLGICRRWRHADVLDQFLTLSLLQLSAKIWLRSKFGIESQKRGNMFEHLQGRTDRRRHLGNHCANLCTAQWKCNLDGDHDEQQGVVQRIKETIGDCP